MSIWPSFISSPRVRTTAVGAFVLSTLLLIPMAASAQASQVAAQPPAPHASSQDTKPDTKPAATQGMTSPSGQNGQYDEQHRPITAGGTVKTGPIVFENFAAQSGLAAWKNVTGGPDKKLIIEAKGSGVCLVDFDRDGWLDIYLVNGSTLDAQGGKAPAPHAALFRNNRDGTFTDVTEKAGVTNERWGLGCAVGDFDNDGWEDLYVTNVGANRLYRNKHDGTFTDVAEKAGVDLKGDSADVVTDHTGATFGDYDGDGRLDLFVAGYVRYDFKNPPVAGSKSVKSATCQYRAVNVMCGPRGLEGAEDHLFHNNGDGTFTDVSKKAGVDDPNHFYGLGSVFVDVNGDRKVDLAVADDSTPNYLYINKGDGTFDDASYTSGFAVNEAGREVANMGLAVGDYENNGHLDIVSTTFSDDYTVVFRNDGTGVFEDVSYRVGVGQPTIPFVGFGDAFLDYDNDGWKDLLIANGHVYPGVESEAGWGMSYAQRPLLFHNDGKGKFDVVPAVEGSGLAATAVQRGAAVGDLFNDGKLDVVINALDGPPLLLRNVNMDRHHWVDLQLVGGAKSPKDAVGATVYLTANGLRQRGDVMSGASYLSSSDMRLHFGLGDAPKVDDLEIHWPSGATEKVKLAGVDRIYTVEEGKGVTAELCRTCAAGK